MQCTLLIPHLFWPRETAASVLSGLQLPAATRLLARSRVDGFSTTTSEGWLCEAFQVAREQDWPVAPLTLQLDGGDPGDAYWLRADPVHLRVDRDRLVLVDNTLFDLSAHEAQALASSLDRHFAPDGITFHAPAPKRWYAKLARAPKLVTRSMSEAAGQDVQRHLPAGADALAWHRFFNEVQMLLHASPVNAEREERGEPAVNSVWLWGGGTRTAVRGRPYDALWSDDTVATALAAAGDVPAHALPSDAGEWLSAAGRTHPGDGSHLIVIDELASVAAYRDSEAWRSRLAALETRWFAPLANALGHGRLARLVVVVPGTTGWRFDLTRADLLKFWRSAKPWSQYA